MNRLFAGALVAAALATSSGAASADEQVSEQRSVDARVLKIALGGVINLDVKQGATPSLILYGDKRDLAEVAVTQQGDTLRIGTTRHDLHVGHKRTHALRAELTLPNLNEFVSEGIGSTELRGFKGERIVLRLDGAGAVRLQSQYRQINARLGGAGNMTLDAGDTERVDLSLRGAGRIEANGQTRVLRADLGGVGRLDAGKLRADAVELDMAGLGSADVFAKNSAKLTLNGLGSATVHGKPPVRSASAHGLGSVTWE
ncbi:DUF2807 domain-containing protein [Massilia antarctica]|uniref:DUF2807 domain-containing protein n=1 Tax=Massilia antarctica TaxID=2765360 RepID=A0AA48WHQ9_9BURK|nr:DUF2807 domain-containing protein [Massilia antarctica]QPI51669.1 DUF2807 domain-containing protein [Massilia antarctica]